MRFAPSPTVTGPVPVNVDITTTADRSSPEGQDDRSVVLTPPVKTWGGKHYLAKDIIALMPKHLHFVEAFCGGCAVLLAKDPLDPRHQWGEKSHEQGISEVVNDVNRELTNFWRVLQGKQTFAEFQRLVEATPFSQHEWQEAKLRQIPSRVPDVDAAVGFFICCRQSRAGECRDFAPLSRNRTRRQMNEQASAWLGAVEGLPEVHARLKRVVILCDDALKVIRSQDGPKTLFYLDPPYLPSTRASKDNYKHEMPVDDHRELLKAIKQCEGVVMLSGYRSELYDEELSGWKRHEFEIDNKAAGGQKKRKMTEVVWMNR